jgi:hypothetical protein
MSDLDTPIPSTQLPVAVHFRFAYHAVMIQWPQCLRVNCGHVRPRIGIHSDDGVVVETGNLIEMVVTVKVAKELDSLVGEAFPAIAAAIEAAARDPAGLRIPSGAPNGKGDGGQINSGDSRGGIFSASGGGRLPDTSPYAVGILPSGLCFAVRDGPDVRIRALTCDFRRSLKCWTESIHRVQGMSPHPNFPLPKISVQRCELSSTIKFRTLCRQKSATNKEEKDEKKMQLSSFFFIYL